MSGDGREDGPDYQEPRVPTALRERIDALFVAYRGYEPASFQESLSLLADLAAERVAADADGSTPANDGDAGPYPGRFPAGSQQPGRAGEPEASDHEAAAEGSFGDAVDFDEYVDGLQSAEEDTAAAVESMLETENADGVVQELAAEVLDEMTDDAFEELEHGVDQGVGAGVTDGMGATEAAGGTTAPSGSVGDGVPESLTADPETDCASCGRAHRVSVLQTTILEEDGSVALVCPSCAD